MKIINFSCDRKIKRYFNVIKFVYKDRKLDYKYLKKALLIK